MEETKGHKYHVLSLMWVLKTLASQEQRVGKRLRREGRQEREGSGNAIDSRHIAFFIRSLQGLWTFWIHDNYLRRWTHCSDFISTHFVFTSDFQTISHKCVQFKNTNCFKKKITCRWDKQLFAVTVLRGIKCQGHWAEPEFTSPLARTHICQAGVTASRDLNFGTIYNTHVHACVHTHTMSILSEHRSLMRWPGLL